MVLHTTFRKGMHILVIMKTGEIIETRFLDKKSTYIVTDIGKIKKSDIRSATIKRGRPET